MKRRIPLLVLVLLIAVLPSVNVSARTPTPTPVQCIPDCVSIRNAIRTRGAGDVIVQMREGTDTASLIQSMKNQPSSGYAMAATPLVISPFAPYIVFTNVTVEGFETILLRWSGVTQVSLDTPESALYGLGLQERNFTGNRNAPFTFGFRRQTAQLAVQCTPTCDELRAKASTTPVSVIVMLQFSETPSSVKASTNPAYSADNWRALGIRYVQSNLIAAMRTARLRLTNLQTYSAIPGLVLTVDRAALDFLIQSPFVFAISENKPRSLS